MKEESVNLNQSEVIQSEDQRMMGDREGRRQWNEQSLRVKLHIIGIPKGKEEENEIGKKTCEDIWPKFSNFDDRRKFAISWSSAIPIRITIKKISPRFISVKVLKVRVKVLFAQSCPILCGPMDCSLPGSSVHGLSQAEILEWVAISFSRGSSWPRDRTNISFTGRSLLLSHLGTLAIIAILCI